MNISHNTSTDGLTSPRSDMSTGLNISIVCLSLTGAMLSLLASMTIAYFPKLRRRASNKLLISLFGADFGVCLLMLVYHALMLDYQLDSDRIKGMGKSINFHLIISAFMFLSVINRTSVTLDRAIAVKRPFFYESKFNTKTVMKIIIGQNVLAVLYLILLFITRNCMNENAFFDVLSLAFIIVVVLGFVVLTVSNIVVFMEARKQIAMICKATTFSKDGKSKRSCQRQKECKVVRINVGMVLVFMVCWLPFLAAICEEHATRKSRESLLMVGLYTVTLNFILDPIIYISLSHDVKNQIKKLLNRPGNVLELRAKRVSETSETITNDL